MARIRWSLVPVALSLGFFFASAAPAAEVLWIYPPPNSLVVESPLTVLGYVLGPPAEDLTGKVVRGGGGGAAPFDLVLYKGKVFSASVALEPGRSNLVVGESVLSVLYRPGAQGDEGEGYRRPFPHGEMLASCNPCHGYYKGEITLTDYVPGLCLGCHEVGTRSLRAVIKDNEHTRKLTPDCLRCHDPHASFDPALLRAEGNPCAGCHPVESRPSGHDELPEGPCTACHDPHGSAYPNLLRGDPIGLCRSCHRDVADPVRYPRSYHRPVEQRKCFVCHTPHGGGGKGMLKKRGAQLCTDCHEDMEEGAHKGQLAECRSCHRPHRSNQRKLLVDDSAEVCLLCHQQDEAGKSQHPAMKEGCNACHDPHRPGSLKSAQKACGRCHGLGDTDFQSTHGDLPMPEVQSCTFCHEPHASKYPSLLRGKIHYPLRNGGCRSCHEVRGGKTELKYEGADNCVRCHGQITGTSTIIETDKVHKPVYQVDCTACHNPHLGDRDKFLLEAPEVLCGWCHGTLLRGVKNRHGVFKEGSCYTCHLPHISDFRPLLKRPQIDLCTRCHTQVVPEDPVERQTVHTVVKDGRCTGCHNPHGTNTENLLRDTPDALCAGCHGGVTRNGEGGTLKFLHGPVGVGTCTACHRLGHRHDKSGDRFLVTPGSEVCARCHDTRPGHAPKRFQPKMREVRGDCLACHLPHGADNPFLMKTGL